MQIPIYQIDAFASGFVRGNPAAICPLEVWLPDATMQAIAEENNLAETAYYVRETGGYRLRWFTPTVEVPLCGHATLAAAAVVLEHRHEVPGSRIAFQTLSGEVAVDRDGDLYTLDFPLRPFAPCDEPAGLFQALGARPREIYFGFNHICVFDSATTIRGLNPDMTRLKDVEGHAVIVTAPGDDCDFVSRFFAPRAGVPEDPVTGSAHSSLIPYWSKRLGKTKMFARQLSARGGELWCEHRGTRVGIGGKTVKFLEGRIFVPVYHS